VRRRGIAYLVTVLLIASGCAVETTSQPTSPAPAPRTQAPATRTVALDPGQAERLKRMMVPLIQVMDHPRPLNQVKVGVIDEPDINAASAGDGEFYVTTGLLQKANDQQLMAVLAHEIAHDDLRHVAKAERLNTGLNIGMVLLDQIIPGSGNLTPIAGTLIARGYSRKEEYQADQHGVVLLQRIGQPKEVMISTLTWLMQTEGTGGGGFFSTHPGTDDRIEALRKS
jgi:Zn-dependent protease with chaperone function